MTTGSLNYLGWEMEMEIEVENETNRDQSAEYCHWDLFTIFEIKIACYG